MGLLNAAQEIETFHHVMDNVLTSAFKKALIKSGLRPNMTDLMSLVLDSMDELVCAEEDKSLFRCLHRYFMALYRKGFDLFQDNRWLALTRKDLDSYRRTGRAMPPASVAETTAAEAKEAFDYLLKVILNAYDIEMALRHTGINNIIDLVYMSCDDIDALPITSAQKLKLRFILQYHLEHNIFDCWKKLTYEEFCEYYKRMDPLEFDPRFLFLSSKRSPAELLRLGKQFSMFLPELEHKTWQHVFRSYRATRTFSDILNPDYSPTTEKEKELFVEKQRFVYAVLECKVSTD